MQQPEFIIYGSQLAPKHLLKGLEMFAQEIKKMSGEIRIISSEEYADKRTGHLFLGNLKVVQEAKLPPALAERVANGDNPIKVWREYRALTARTLSELIGVSGAYLSQIENGKRTGTIIIYKKIAQALNVNIGDLI